MGGKSKLTRLVELLRSEPTELDAYLVAAVEGEGLDGTKATVRCYALCLDGALLPRQADLARHLAERLVDFAIPRSDIEKAKKESDASGSTAPLVRLVKKASALFTTSTTTGEPGELLLYHLAETYLRAPQVLCKLPHKTNKNMHVHGIDGMHMRYEPSDKTLCLFWGESKLKTSFSGALQECIADLKPFLCGDTAGTRRRDLELVRDNVDFSNKAVEDAFLDYLNPKSPLHNSTVHRGVSLVGFDYEHYPTKPNDALRDALLEKVRDSYKQWKTAVLKRVTDLSDLSAIHLDIFLVPMPSTEDFRKAFLEELNGAAT